MNLIPSFSPATKSYTNYTYTEKIISHSYGLVRIYDFGSHSYTVGVRVRVAFRCYSHPDGVTMLFNLSQDVESRTF